MSSGAKRSNVVRCSSVDDCGDAARVEGDEAGGHAGDDALIKHLGGRRPRACLRAQFLQLFLLRAQLRHDRLKSFKHKLRLITRTCRERGDGGAFGFADKLPVGAQQPAGEQKNSGQTDQQCDDEDRVQHGRTHAALVRRQSHEREREQVRHQQQPDDKRHCQLHPVFVTRKHKSDE